VKTDDLLKASPQLAPYRPEADIAPQLSDAELVTLSMMQALLGFTSEARWIRHARSHLRHLFPYLPGQVGEQQAATQGHRADPAGHTPAGRRHHAVER